MLRALFLSCSLIAALIVFAAPCRAIPYNEARDAFEEGLTLDERILAQILLTANGYLPVVPMEHLNRSTYDAIRSFEIDNGFPAITVLDGPRLNRLNAQAAPNMRMWGFQKIAYPGRPIAIWAPLGLGMAVQENATGLHFRDPQGRLQLDMTSKGGLNIKTAYENQLADNKKHSGEIHYKLFKNDEGWFAISSTWGDGSDHYYRFHQDGIRVTGFALEWNNNIDNINAERIAVIMSGSLRAAMIGAPFVDPPKMPAPRQESPVAKAPQPPAAAPVATVAAPQSADSAGCSAVREAAARLACFDAAAGTKHEASAGPTDDTSVENRSVARDVAPPIQKALGVPDLGAMHSTYEKNQARFFRDYKGRQYAATMPLHSVIEDIVEKKTYNVSFGTSWNGDVSCHVSDQETIDLITNSDKGDKIIVEGKVDDHTFGVVNLTTCHLERSVSN